MNTTLPAPPLLSIRQVSAYLNISIRSVYRLVQEGKLRGCLPGRRGMRFRFSDVEALTMATALPHAQAMEDLDDFINNHIQR